ncbi:hypothetical protein Dform_00375 [Dehalogenimonas formicexedens]|uniref:HTH HARE-type domain-containing protein n=1 Tax=Dehalogenimonas formicexedens TaxID=1839801 RepID=A0A1P8F5H7_9CHLR|nr:winged helix-turn-helix domain-containing protein [Dehalogenimonas formicexedens]APV43734.1 hypothetical protein Dform_00375 [Dehalogenimonas formicexedens]
MTDQSNVSKALLVKKEELICDIKQIDQMITTLETEHAKKLVALKKQKKPLEEALMHLNALLSLGKISSTPILSITDLAFAYLEKVGKPSHYKEISRHVQNSGIQIVGKNPDAIILTRITRDNRFKRAHERGTYALANWNIRKKRKTTT